MEEEETEKILVPCLDSTRIESSSSSSIVHTISSDSTTIIKEEFLPLQSSLVNPTTAVFTVTEIDFADTNVNLHQLSSNVFKSIKNKNSVPLVIQLESLRMKSSQFNLNSPLHLQLSMGDTATTIPFRFIAEDLKSKLEEPLWYPENEDTAIFQLTPHLLCFGTIQIDLYSSSSSNSFNWFSWSKPVLARAELRCLHVLSSFSSSLSSSLSPSFSNVLTLNFFSLRDVPSRQLPSQMVTELASLSIHLHVPHTSSSSFHPSTSNLRSPPSLSPSPSLSSFPFSSGSSNWLKSTQRALDPLFPPLLKQVFQLLSTLTQGLEDVSTFDWVWGLNFLQRYFDSLPSDITFQTVSAKRSQRPVITDQVFLCKVWLYNKYAMAAYGWKGVVAFRKTWILNQKKAKIKNLPFLTHQDWILDALDQPCGYLLVHDRDENALIISLRGTMSSSDALTDILCDYHFTNEKEGYVHQGIYQASQSLLPILVPQVLNAMNERKVTKVVFVGHSLGGALAFFLTYYFIYTLKCEETECYAFASPPLTTWLPKDITPFHFFIYKEDVVPRLSFGSIWELRHCFLATLHRPSFHQLDFIRTQLIQSSLYPKLMLPGTVYYLHHVLEHQHEVWKVSASLFSHLQLRSTMFSDHFPVQYEHHLEGCIKDLAAIKEELSRS